MKKNIHTLAWPLLCLLIGTACHVRGQNFIQETKDTLQYHRIKINSKDGTIVPWYDPDPTKAYDHTIQLIWNFWDNMRKDSNGLPYYMNHQVWRPDFNDRRGIGGDQISMALSSWGLLYAYSGNEKVKENMKFMADYYLSHSLSPADVDWPNLPYPYNTLIYSGKYDGDMVIGPNFTQPDKAGSFGLELLKLHKMTETRIFGNVTEKRYLKAAIQIANTLAGHIKQGNYENSPLPFKVNALTGEVGKLKSNKGDDTEVQSSSYTSNWAPTMELFLGLIAMGKGQVESYKKGFQLLLEWMKVYPLKNNRWGPFFEDIPGWSDTQVNAITFAQFIMNHQEYFPEWRQQVDAIFQWVYTKLGNKTWENYGVLAINEQTVYQTPGNSHTSRQASAELQYAAIAGKGNLVEGAIRKLNWATYMVDVDGKNKYPRDEVWLTDGYGDYVRHYLRSMAYFPQLAPDNKNHLLYSSSIVQHMEYAPQLNKFLVPEVALEKVSKTLIHYRTYDDVSTEVIRMVEKPKAILVNDKVLPENDGEKVSGWHWENLKKGGILTIRHQDGNKILVMGN
ncbi:hypothetical protein [Ulvibacterium sp.]|uniref:hypothetical protein n=1 Tax=Ulvibacterium sp. TaxID=2665914 RepID=UPI003CC5F347